jgi:hypothetical protein
LDYNLVDVEEDGVGCNAHKTSRHDTAIAAVMGSLTAFCRSLHSQKNCTADGPVFLFSYLREANYD